MRLEVPSELVQYVLAMRNSLDVGARTGSPRKSSTVNNRYKCRGHVSSHKMSQRSTTQSSSSSYENKSRVSHSRRSLPRNKSPESCHYKSRNQSLESKDRHTKCKTRPKVRQESQPHYKSKRHHRKHQNSSSRNYSRHSSRHHRRDSQDDAEPEKTQDKTPSSRHHRQTRHSEVSANSYSNKNSPEESPYKRRKRNDSPLAFKRKDSENTRKTTKRHLLSSNVDEKGSENDRASRRRDSSSGSSRVDSVRDSGGVTEKKTKERVSPSKTRYKPKDEDSKKQRTRTQSPKKDKLLSSSSKRKRKEPLPSPHSGETTKSEAVSPTERHSKKRDIDKKKKILEPSTALTENELSQKDAADEETRKHERLQRVRRLMEEKKRKKTSEEIPVKPISETPAAKESSDGEAPAQEKAQDQSVPPGAQVTPLLEFKLAIKPEDLPLPYQGEYQSYLQTVTEPDTLDDYMMTIETEMQELNFAPKKVRRKKKKQSVAADTVQEGTSKSISLEEILKLQSEAAAAVASKKQTSEKGNLSSGGQTVSSLKEIVSGEKNSLVFSPSVDKAHTGLESDSGASVASFGSDLVSIDSTTHDVSVLVKSGENVSEKDVLPKEKSLPLVLPKDTEPLVPNENDERISALKPDDAVTESVVAEEPGERGTKNEIDIDEEDYYYRAFIAEVKRKQAEKENIEEVKGDESFEVTTTEIIEDRLSQEADEKKAPKRNGEDAKKNRLPITRNQSQQIGKGGDDLDDLDEEDYRYNLASEEDSLESYFDLAQKVGSRKELPAVDHSAIDYPSFQKNLYIQVREITLMKDHEVDALRSLNGNIRVRGKMCPRPIRTFYQCGIPDSILKIMEKRDYEKPFPIQMQSLPSLMAGRDIIGIAETGSGKTLAYLLPVIRHILAQPELKPSDGPICLILAPTRELTVQIQREALKFCKAVGLRSIAVYGGTGIGEQLSALKRGAELIVATPGRLIDVLTINNGKIVNLRRVTFCVLDEADRMFDMGFEPQITSILKNVRPDAQKALFSATFPPYIENLARKILRKPLEITVGERGQTAAHVEQFVEVWKTVHEKFLRLLQLLGEWSEHGSVIVFVSRQTEADELFAELLKYGYASLVLHGGQDQTDRDFTIQDFKGGAASILIATSVAARGLDVKAVVLVINYCAPDHLEDYIHRIGRTGRAGNIGVAYTFLLPEEGDKAEDMIKVLKQHGKEVPSSLLSLLDTYKLQCNMGIAKQHGKGGFGGKGFKFTPSEKSRQQQEQIRAKKELGLNESDEEDQYSSLMMGGGLDEFPESAPQIPSATVSAAPVAAASPAILPPTAQVLSLMPPGGIHGSEVDSASARAKALAELVVKQHASSQSSSISYGTVQPKVASTLMVPSPPNVGAASPTLSLAQKSLALATQAAASLMGQTMTSANGIRSAVSPVFGLSQSSYIDQATGNFVEEFEINDYPQTARFKVTHKDILNRIADQSGAVLQVKGRYVAPEEKEAILLSGVKKLYIEIIGTTPIIIQRAKHELRTFIEAISMKQLNLSATSGRPIGRYSVV